MLSIGCNAYLLSLHRSVACYKGPRTVSIQEGGVQDAVLGGGHGRLHPYCSGSYGVGHVSDGIVVRVVGDVAVIVPVDVHCSIAGLASAFTVGASVGVEHEIPHDDSLAPIVHGTQRHLLHVLYQSFLQIPSMDKRIYLDGYTFRIPEEFYEMTLYDFMQLPDIPVTESSSESYSESNPYNGISSSERDKQLKEKKNQLTSLTIDRKEAVLKYEKMRREVSSGTILSTVNGQVKITGDVENVINASVPLITVTSQDGFYLKGTVNELKLDQIEVGHTVTVTNMETGMIAEAKITSISDYPVSDNNNSYGTNPNTSNYPFTAYLEETAGFKNNQSVSISVQTGETSSTSAIYIPLAYIRDEGGETFVYIADENNRLKKQVVDTGAILYGYYQEIKSGLTSEDLITFPYGKNVKEGVKTETVDSPSMY